MKRKKSRCLICTIIPDDLIKPLKASQASNNFCRNLIEYIQFDKIYSIWPPSYKTNRKELPKENIDYIINKGKNILSSLFFYIICNIKLAFKAKNQTYIWYYNLCNSNLLSYIVLRFIFQKDIFIILADHTPGKKLSLQNYIEHLIRTSSGIISLSARTSINNKNKKVLAGILPLHKISQTIPPLTNYKFLFSGTLSPVTGFDMALKVFKELPNAELYISGIGTMPKEFEKYPNIHYMGMLEYNEYLKIFDKIDFCLNFRNPNLPENNNNFPSKILEYFSHNKIIISTIDYPELIDFKYIKARYNKENLIQVIQATLSMKKSELAFYQDNRNNLANHFSENIWKETITLIENH